MTVAVTGANGKLGRALVAAFSANTPVHAIARVKPTILPANTTGFGVGPLNSGTQFSEALQGVSTLVHCAALTWMDPTSSNQAAFTTVNVDATRSLGIQAVAANVKRIVFISSLTVNGKHNAGRPFRADDVPDPQTFYSRSKWEAEQALHSLEAEHDIEVAVIRPPRIIWPELSGNLAMMANLIAKGVPLPFALLDKNSRDNVSSERLVAEIVRAATDPSAAGKTLLVSDGEPMSTRALAFWVGERVGRKPILVPVPVWLLRPIVNAVPQFLLGKLNRAELLDELTLDLQVEEHRD
jgi:nucleoside-diphosphate-sugar epimerase